AGRSRTSMRSKTWRALRRASPKDSRFAAYVSASTLTTVASVPATSARTRAEPMNPTPPVTMIVLTAPPAFVMRPTERSTDPLDLNEAVQLLGGHAVGIAPVRRIDAHGLPRPQRIERRPDLTPDLSVLEGDHIAVRHGFAQRGDDAEKLLALPIPPPPGPSVAPILRGAQPEVVRVRRRPRHDLALADHAGSRSGRDGGRRALRLLQHLRLRQRFHRRHVLSSGCR